MVGPLIIFIEPKNNKPVGIDILSIAVCYYVSDERTEVKRRDGGSTTVKGNVVEVIDKINKARSNLLSGHHNKAEVKNDQ